MTTEARAAALPKPVLARRYVGAMNTIRRIREGGERALEQGGGTALAVAGGLAVGQLHSRYPAIRGQSVITAGSVMGIAAVLVGMTIEKSSPKASWVALDFGQGALAGQAAILSFLDAEKRKGTR